MVVITNRLEQLIKTIQAKPKTTSEVCQKVTGRLPSQINILTEDIIELSEKAKFLKELYRKFDTKQMNIKINGKEKEFTIFIGSKSVNQTSGFWVKNEQGQLYYIKHATDKASRAKLESELIAQKLYELTGVNTVNSVPVELENGNFGIMSEYLGKFETIYKPDEAGEIYRGFGPDVWLANTDTFAGFVDEPNTTIFNGKLLKIDAGDTLEFSNKRFHFNDKVSAIQDFVNPEKTCFISRMYDEIPRSEVIKSFESVCQVSDEEIIKVCKNEQLAQKMINRRNYMQKFLDLMNETPQTERNFHSYIIKIF